MQRIGTVLELWRYPVKSMAGETIDRTTLTRNGIPGDRVWALRDEAAGEIRGAKKLPALLRCGARLMEEPQGAGHSPAAEITMPDGRRTRSDAPEAAALLRELLGREVSLCPLRPADDLAHYRRGMPDDPDVLAELRQIFGREENEPLPDITQFPPEIMEFTSPLGTYFDVFPLHLVTTSSLAELKRLAPPSDFDARRFRPNILVDSGEAAGFVENGWTGRRLRAGGATIRIEMPTVRCSMIAQPQAELQKDSAVLRTVVRDAEQNCGSYAVIVEEGELRKGDELFLLDD